MLYALQDYTYHAATPMRLAALMARNVWGAPGNPLSKTEFGRTLFAGPASDFTVGGGLSFRLPLR